MTVVGRMRSEDEPALLTECRLLCSRFASDMDAELEAVKEAAIAAGGLSVAANEDALAASERQLSPTRSMLHVMRCVNQVWKTLAKLTLPWQARTRLSCRSTTHSAAKGPWSWPRR